MATPAADQPRRVLIVSSHPLFGQGMRGLLQARYSEGVTVVGMVSNVEEAMAALESLQPNLVVVDYDDDQVNRDEFLARFVEGAHRLRVVLLSLKEGGSEAIVYDRRTMAAAQIDDWLKEWNDDTAARPEVLTEKKYRPFRRHTRTKIIPRMDTPTDPRRADMKHFIFAAIVVVALAAALLFGLEQVRLLPVAASLQAGPIDWLFDFHFKAIAILFSLIVGLMLYSIIVFRRRSGDDTDATHIEGNTTLEVMWTLVPLVIVIYVSYLGAQILGVISRPDPQALEVRVVGSQWSWRFEYPDQGITSNELVLPVDQQVELELISTDVIHSFWVPEFRVKQDALPGGEEMVRYLRITPNLIGEYKVRCAEMCGKQHAIMESPVRVVSQADYDTWLSDNSVISDDPVERGAQIAQQFACISCHSIDGTQLVGPTWLGVFGSERTMADGTTVIADEAYLHMSIVDPHAQLVQGYGPIMPANIAADMTEEQIADVIEYMKSLSGQ